MSTLERLNEWARRSVTLKLLVIGVMILFLLIPTSMLDGLIRDRQSLRDSAQTEVASKWGLQQTVGGPVISVPYRYQVLDAEGKTLTTSGYAHFLPDEINIEGTLNPEERYRGIFVVVLYNTRLQVTGHFGAYDAAALNIPETALQWEDAIFSIGLSDMTGVQAAIDLRFGDTTRSLGPGTITNDLFDSGASTAVTVTGAEQRTDFSFSLDLNGSSALYFRPFGKRTTVQLSGGWGNPSFDGSFLPQEREVSPAGFTATWEVLQLNRNYPQQGTGAYIGKSSRGYVDGGYVEGGYYPDGAVSENDVLGLRLLLPVDEYQKTYRSTSFAVLFIFITFLTFFFIEVLNKRKVHPVQYLLIGAAIILFYVLLLSISEHLLFASAYWLSCAAVVTLITGYSWFILRNLKLTLLVAGILVILYVFFYSLLQLQDYALLVGSLGLLLILATIMWLTRNIDWYQLNREE
ncbi:cell envelope integrity protein CreD [Neolewinella lacunae]|uniref:Cell envelope integrity protein CreD n=1 Tax=Neolewinella lacunae TaxID=1517758 RepID=A0A923PKW6_9BACT|nr:cell envelope integrity protein CreD [Neolewinella lacunae]MBC6994581.1 cell envelope integrity protein CreD [Neolewinella lacunae]MDN3633930.1 cell envelope integrity protein CreD [Neolewinella lacunae]